MGKTFGDEPTDAESSGRNDNPSGKQEDQPTPTKPVIDRSSTILASPKSAGTSGRQEQAQSEQSPKSESSSVSSTSPESSPASASSEPSTSGSYSKGDSKRIAEEEAPKPSKEDFIKNIEAGNLEGIKKYLERGLKEILDGKGYLIEMEGRQRGGYGTLIPDTLETPLTFVLNPQLKLSPEQRLDIIKLLIQYKQDPNQANSLGNTPIILASKLKDNNIIDFLLSQNVDDLVIRLDRAKAAHGVEAGAQATQASQKEKKRDSETSATETDSQYTFSDTGEIAKLAGVIARTADLMQKNAADPITGQNIFNTKGSLPTMFSNYKFKIPPSFNLPFMGKDKITGVKVIAGYDTARAHQLLQDDRTELRVDLMESLQFFDPKTHRNIVMQVTLDNGRKEMLTIQTKEDADLLQQIVSEFGFYEEAFVAPEPAFTAAQWDFEASDPYAHETESFYAKDLHPEIMKDIHKSLELRKSNDSIIVEIGAGRGNLSMNLFKQLATPESEVHVIGAELVASNVKDAKIKAEAMTKSGSNTLDFVEANSVSLLSELEKSKMLDKIHKMQSEYIANHNKQLPLIIASSGALNRLVLNDVFESTRVMQNIYRMQPDLMVVSGITETLLNQHILKNLGFTTLSRRVDIEAGGGHYYKLKAKTPGQIAEYFNDKLKRKPGQLDLSLNPDPLAVLSLMDDKALSQVTKLNISHAFFRTEDELRIFLERANKGCPNLKEIVYDYHFVADNNQLNKVMEHILHDQPDSRLKDIIKSTQTAREQELAFTQNFIARAIRPGFLARSSAERADTDKKVTKEGDATKPTDGEPPKKPAGSL